MSTELVARTPDGMVPTAAGQLAIDVARGIESEIETLATRVSGGDDTASGLVRISVTESVAPNVSRAMAPVCDHPVGKTLLEGHEVIGYSEELRFTTAWQWLAEHAQPETLTDQALVVNEAWAVFLPERRTEVRLRLVLEALVDMFAAPGAPFAS